MWQELFFIITKSNKSPIFLFTYDLAKNQLNFILSRKFSTKCQSKSNQTAFYRLSVRANREIALFSQGYPTVVPIASSLSRLNFVNPHLLAIYFFMLYEISLWQIHVPLVLNILPFLYIFFQICSVWLRF